MIIPMLCVTIFVILVVWFLLPRVARLMIHTPTAICIFVCLSMVQRSEERFSRNAEGRKANDSHADCYQYFCVPEYGTANGRLDRKSGSAGMPRPISYAVFCLKKKINYALSRHVGGAYAWISLLVIV